MIKILQYCAKTVVYGSLIGAPTILIVSAVTCAILGTTPGQDVETKSTYLGFAMLFGIAGAVASLIVMCMCFCWQSSIKMTIALLKAVGEVMQKNCSMTAIAISSSILTVLYLTFMLAFFEATRNIMNADKTKSENFNDTIITKHINGNGGAVAMAIFGIFMMYTGLNVFANTSHIAFAKIFGKWYFSVDAEEHVEGGLTVTKLSLGGGFMSLPYVMAWTKHFGSACYGAFILAVVQTLRTLANYAERQVKKAGSKDKSGAGKVVYYIFLCLLGCIKCILKCIEDLLEFFGKIAYVHVSIYNQTFCQSVRSTMKLMQASGVKALVNDNIMGLVTVCLGSILFAATSLLNYCIFAYIPGMASHHEGLSKRIIVLCMVAISGVVLLFILSCGKSIVRSGMLSIFVCYAEHPDTLAITHPELAVDFATATQRSFLGQGKVDEENPGLMKPSADVKAPYGTTATLA